MNVVKHLLLLATVFLLVACSAAKLEARLEANPQCKDVMNPKTGALMPCPGSDKAFYREVGLAHPKSAPTINSPPASAPNPLDTTVAVQTSSNPSTSSPVVVNSTQNPTVFVECKPQIHKKTGGTLPCPAPD